jgi:hypothetical protein
MGGGGDGDVGGSRGGRPEWREERLVRGVGAGGRGGLRWRRSEARRVSAMITHIVSVLTEAVAEK